MFALRLATEADIPIVAPRSRTLNAHEGITIPPGALEAALGKLIADPSLGGVWVIERVGKPVGYAIVTFGYDLEFAGRDSYLTEFWIDPEERGHGAGTAALVLLDPELRARDVRALHLRVRPENPAFRLYERAGFVAGSRVVMTRRL